MFPPLTAQQTHEVDLQWNLEGRYSGGTQLLMQKRHGWSVPYGLSTGEKITTCTPLWDTGCTASTSESTATPAIPISHPVAADNPLWMEHTGVANHGPLSIPPLARAAQVLSTWTTKFLDFSTGKIEIAFRLFHALHFEYKKFVW